MSLICYCRVFTLLVDLHKNTVILYLLVVLAAYFSRFLMKNKTMSSDQSAGGEKSSLRSTKITVRKKVNLEAAGYGSVYV